MTPLRRLQTAAFAKHSEKMQHYGIDRATYEADLSEWKKRGRKNSEPPPVEPKEPVAIRYVVEDTTVEALTVLLENQPRGGPRKSDPAGVVVVIPFLFRWLAAAMPAAVGLVRRLRAFLSSPRLYPLPVVSSVQQCVLPTYQ